MQKSQDASFEATITKSSAQKTGDSTVSTMFAS